MIQVANSAFPMGAFNHSYGFETLITNGDVSDAETLEKACDDWLLYSVAPSDGAGVVLAHRSATEGDINKLIELDNLIGSLKLAREIREASYKMGYAFLNAVMGIFEPDGLVERYKQAIKEGNCKGNQAIAFGSVASFYGSSEEEAVLVFFQSSLSNLITVAARLIPLGQIEAQHIITNTWPLLHKAVNIAMSRRADDLGSSAVALEIAAMEHERLYTRLCMS